MWVNFDSVGLLRGSYLLSFSGSYMATPTELTFPNSNSLWMENPRRKKLLADRRKSTSFHVNSDEKSGINHNILTEKPRIYLRDKWVVIVTESSLPTCAF